MNAHTATQSVNVGNSWAFQTSPTAEVLPRKGVEEMLAALQVWQRVFTPENTHTQFRHGVPSLFVRFDCVYTPERGLEIFEIEEKPCGMHACAVINPDFAARRDAVRSEWPAFRWVQGERRESDDGGWLGPPVTLEEALAAREPILVRCMPTAVEFHELSNFSISTLKLEGDKNYGAKMGLWSIIRSNPDGSIDGTIPDTAFVIKPIQGTRCRDVSICLNGENEVRKINGRGEVPFLRGRELVRSGKDLVSRTQAEKKIRTWGGAVCQPYIAPLCRDYVPGRNVILRFYFGYSTRRSRWIPLGGAWVASHALRVHGEDGVISGPLTFE